MDQSPKICTRCQQANFPIAEFCRHCGEPILDLGSLSRASFIARMSGHIADGLVWIGDEFRRWWEIGRITVELKNLMRKRSRLLKGLGRSDSQGLAELSPKDREELMGFSEAISRLSSRDEYLRKRSWGLAPELLLLTVVLAFVAGILWIRPRLPGAIVSSAPAVSFQGEIKQAAEISITGHSVVTSAAWWQGRLYVGGDGGLTVVDPGTGVATQVAGLPAGFFVRHLHDDGQRLLIAGFGGIYSLDQSFLRPLYEGARLPVDLVNRIAAVKDGGHLIGTVGHGLLKGNGDVAYVILGTQGLTLRGFEWLDGELWLLHERGLLKGDGTTFTPVSLQVFSGKDLTSLAVENSTIFIGSNDGVIAGYKNGRDWVWTPISPGRPKKVTNLVVSQGTLLVCSEEGFFRYRNGVFDEISGGQNQSVAAPGPIFLATAGPRSVKLFRLAPSQGGSEVAAPAIPTVGTYASPVPLTGPVGFTGPVGLTGPVALTGPAPTPISQGSPIGQTPAPAVSAAPSPAPLPAPQVFSSSQQPQAPSPAAVPPFSAPVPPAPQVSGPPDPVFGTVPLPTMLTGPFLSSLAWDGGRLWVGTTNGGLFSFQDGQWKTRNKETGTLADNQVVALWTFQGKTFLYSWIMGILSLDGPQPSVLLGPDKIDGLLSMAWMPSSPMFLFRGGHVKKLGTGGTLENFSRIPEDFFNTARHIQVVNQQPVVVTDPGVLSLNDLGRWVVTFFTDRRPDSRAVFSTVSPDGRLFSVLSDGRVFSYSARTVQKIGDIGQPPRGIAFDETLWVAGTTRVFRLSGTSLTEVGPPVDSGILGIQPVSSRRALLVATNGGLKTFPLDR